MCAAISVWLADISDAWLSSRVKRSPVSRPCLHGCAVRTKTNTSLFSSPTAVVMLPNNLGPSGSCNATVRGPANPPRLCRAGGGAKPAKICSTGTLASLMAVMRQYDAGPVDPSLQRSSERGRASEGRPQIYQVLSPSRRRPCMATTCKAWRHCIAAAHARPFGSFSARPARKGL